ncbi:MAG: adenylosuccinate synthase, partial [Actinobacteria bacterium]|nr:adenylosuccinate synthase [Actinomycetota bacterium]
VYNLEPLNLEEIFEKYKSYVGRIGKYIIDTSMLINRFLEEGRLVFFEGAQGTLLDIDHGTYPFVTSSSTIAGGACIGAGVGPKQINEIIGVMKAYTTRVGSGPFPSEIEDRTADYIREKGYEYGTTTGRPRRCGWLDVLIVKYSIMINSIDRIALTKLDVLSGIDEIKICYAYDYEGKIYKDLPPHQTIMHKCKPLYKVLKGWKENIDKIKTYNELPENTKKYIEEVEKLIKIPISLVSVGPERNQIIIRDINLERKFLNRDKKPLLVL